MEDDEYNVNKIKEHTIMSLRYCLNDASTLDKDFESIAVEALNRQ
jgi:hypothetical protein